MKQRDAFAPQRQRNPELLGDRIVAGGLGDRPEVLAQRFQRRRIVRPAEQHVLGLAIQPGELAQQIPDVGADAEIVQLSRVNADPHADIITGAECVVRGCVGAVRASAECVVPVRECGARRCGATCGGAVLSARSRAAVPVRCSWHDAPRTRHVARTSHPRTSHLARCVYPPIARYAASSGQTSG